MAKDTDVEFDEDLFDSMVQGTFEEPEVSDEVEDTDDETDDQEDTDQEEELEDEEETNDDPDGDDDDTSDTDEDDEEEDSLVEDYDSDDEADEEDVDESDESEDDESDDSEQKSPDGEESEDDTETNEKIDGDTQATDEVDYKAFYDAVVNTEFVVNGKKVKGFADPQKIIQSQQMAGGFSEKMAGFKQYRPFMAPLKERGMLDDKAKFDLAMNLVDGDKEAIKQHLKSLDIDPIDLDMDEIAYQAKPTTASIESLVVEDTMERAKSLGVGERVAEVIGKEWDDASFAEFVDNDAVRNDLLEHISTGVYDTVQDKMNELSRLDYDGVFGNMSTVNKYRAAFKQLQAEDPSKVTPVGARQAPARTTKPKKTTTVKAEKAKIVDARKAEEYKEKATKREAKISQQRKRAASVSRKKAKAKPKPKFDPATVEGEELDNLMEYLMQNGSSIPTS